MESSFEGKGLEVNFVKTKIMESGGGSRVVVLAKIDPYGACGKRIMVSCVRCNAFNVMLFRRVIHFFGKVFYDRMSFHATT